MSGVRTALGRSLVPWHPATGWALFASTVILVTAGLSHGLASGLRGAAVALLTWAIVRELAPRRAIPSLLAPFAAIAFAIPADADLVGCLAILVAARIGARSTGAPPTHLDSVLLLGLVIACAMHADALPAGVVLAAVVAADAPPRRLRVVGILLLGAALVTGSLEGTLTMRPEWTLPPLQGLALLASTVLATIWLLLAPLPSQLAVHDDRGRAPLRGTRIRSARIVVVAGVGATMLWTGTSGAFVAAAGSGALLAAGLGGARQRALTSSDAASDTMHP